MIMIRNRRLRKNFNLLFSFSLEIIALPLTFLRPPAAFLESVKNAAHVSGAYSILFYTIFIFFVVNLLQISCYALRVFQIELQSASRSWGKLPEE